MKQRGLVKPPSEDYVSPPLGGTGGLLLLGHVGLFAVHLLEAEVLTSELLAHLARLGEAYVDATDVLHAYAASYELGIALFVEVVGVVDVVSTDGATGNVLALVLVPDAGLEGGSEGAEGAESDAVAELDLLDDDLLEGDEDGLDVDLGEGTLLHDAEDDVVGGGGAVEDDGGVPSEAAIDGLAALNFVPTNHSLVV